MSGVKDQAYLQGRIWKYLRRNPGGLPASTIKRALKIKSKATGQILCRMKRKGAVRLEGTTHKARWFSTDLQPIDTRGLSVNSMANLKQNMEQWKDRLKATAIGRGRDPNAYDRPQVPRPWKSTSLEQQWGWGVEKEPGGGHTSNEGGGADNLQEGGGTIS
jgi:hypothetical protein